MAMLVRGRIFSQTTDGDIELGPETRWCSRRTPGMRQRSAPTAYAASKRPASEDRRRTAAGDNCVCFPFRGHIARPTRRRQRSRVAITSALLIALYVGLSVLVIGAGIALTLGASAPDTVLGFAILVRRCRLGLGTACDAGPEPRSTSQ